MPMPDDDKLPPGVEAYRLADGQLNLSQPLVDLLISARCNYHWPKRTGSAESQRNILNLEAAVASWMNPLSESNSHEIVHRVSKWAGSRTSAKVANAATSARMEMLRALNLLAAPCGLTNGLNLLSSLDGVGLVIAAKVYRFCRPEIGAAVDRHASYFFNSLDIVDTAGQRSKATQFRREWTNGSGGASRLAAYSTGGYSHNLQQFVGTYLPLLMSISAALNALSRPYT